MAVLKGGRGCKIEAMNTAFFQSVGYSVEDVLTGSRDIYRWRRLDGRYHNPNEFVSVLEKLGYINDLDFYIFEEAVRCLKNGMTQERNR